MFALAAALAAAQSPAIAFAPPLAPLAVETQEVHRTHGRTLHFTMRHDIRFSRLGQGWRLDATLRGYTTDATGGAKAAYDAAMRPFVGVTTAVAVSAGGAPVGPLDAEATWTKIAAAQQSAADALGKSGLPPPVVAALRAHFDAVIAQPRAGREAMLTDFASTLLALSAPALQPGETQPFEDQVSIPGAGAIIERGTTHFEASADGRAVFMLDAEVDPAALAAVADRLDATLTARDPARPGRLAAAAQLRATRVMRHDRSVVDMRTGLLVETVSRRETRVPGAPEESVERTTRVLAQP